MCLPFLAHLHKLTHTRTTHTFTPTHDTHFFSSPSSLPIILRVSNALTRTHIKRFEQYKFPLSSSKRGNAVVLKSTFSSSREARQKKNSAKGLLHFISTGTGKIFFILNVTLSEQASERVNRVPNLKLLFASIFAYEDMKLFYKWAYFKGHEIGRMEN